MLFFSAIEFISEKLLTPDKSLNNKTKKEDNIIVNIFKSMKKQELIEKTNTEIKIILNIIFSLFNIIFLNNRKKVATKKYKKERTSKMYCSAKP